MNKDKDTTINNDKNNNKDIVAQQQKQKQQQQQQSMQDDATVKIETKNENENPNEKKTDNTNKIRPRDVKQQNFEQYLKEQAFDEYDKIRNVKLSHILKSDEQHLKGGLKNQGVNYCKIGSFIEAIKKIPDSEIYEPKGR